MSARPKGNQRRCILPPIRMYEGFKGYSMWIYIFGDRPYVRSQGDTNDTPLAASTRPPA